MLSKLLLSTFLLVTVHAMCPPETIYDGLFNKCYKYVNEPLSFVSAELRCQAMGWHLVSISSAYENAYVAGIANQGGAPPKYWIGGNLLLTSNWTWTNGQALVFTNWSDDEPKDPSAKQCNAVELIRNQSWTKEICYTELPFVCAISINALPTTTWPPAMFKRL